MYIPLSIALLIDIVGAALFFVFSLMTGSAGYTAAGIGFFIGMLAFLLSSYVQHNRAIGADVTMWALSVMFLAAFSFIILAGAFITWATA